MAKKKKTAEPKGVERKVQRTDGSSLEEIEVVEGFKRDIMLKQIPVKKICILGTCPSRMLAPFNDIEWQFWTIGPGGSNANRWEQLFEVHGTESWPDGFAEYMSELDKVQPPRVIWTEAPMPRWPANKVLPKDALFAKYGRMWFSSSISYAIAMALEDGVTDMGVYGIDLESSEEYRSQFAGARHFIDLARLAGVNIHMPKGCGLLRDVNPYPEAWETHLAHTIQAKLDWLGSLEAQKRAEHGQLSADINMITGEKSAFEFLKQMYILNGEPADAPVPHKISMLTQEQRMERVLQLLEALVVK